MGKAFVAFLWDILDFTRTLRSEQKNPIRQFAFLKASQGRVAQCFLPIVLAQAQVFGAKGFLFNGETKPKQIYKTGHKEQLNFLVRAVTIDCDRFATISNRNLTRDEVKRCEAQYIRTTAFQ